MGQKILPKDGYLIPASGVTGLISSIINWRKKVDNLIWSACIINEPSQVKALYYLAADIKQREGT